MATGASNHESTYAFWIVMLTFSFDVTVFFQCLFVIVIASRTLLIGAHTLKTLSFSCNP